MKYGVIRSQQSRSEITELDINSRVCRSQLNLNCRVACLDDCELIMSAIVREKQQKLIYQQRQKERVVVLKVLSSGK
jgi:hypothetical protein